MIIRHDISNGMGRFAYSVDGVRVALNYGKNAETEKQIEKRLGDTIVDLDGTKEHSDLLEKMKVNKVKQDRRMEFEKLSAFQQCELIIDALEGLAPNSEIVLWSKKIKSDIK